MSPSEDTAWQEYSAHSSPPGSKVFISGSSIRGKRHEKNGQPCQDAWSFSTSKGGAVSVIAVADGLSSAEYAQEGARAAVNAACQVGMSSPSYDEEPCLTTPVTRMLATRAVRLAREAVLSLAYERGKKPADLASTLIVLVISGDSMAIAHIGDGIAIGIRKEGPIILSEPGISEYANETACLIQHDWEEQMRVTELTGTRGCILATDGCQGALAVRTGGELIPYEPFIIPLISFVDAKIAADEDPIDDITSLLQSSRMQDLSGDDKTLVVVLFRDRP